MKRVRDLKQLLSESFSAWMNDQATTMSAALSYYTVFSIAPLILIALAIGGIFFGAEASRGEVFGAVRGLLGDDGAQAVESMVEASSLREASIVATVVGVATLIVGSTTVFAQLQDSLNTIWKVRPRPGKGLRTLLRQRVLSFSLILVLAFLLLVSLIATAVLSALGTYATTNLPGGEAIWQVVNQAVSFGIVSLLFAAIYKILPDVHLRWRDVWTGGLITAFFFTLGKFLIGLYIGKSGVASTYGAAGSAVVLMLWTYYSSAILLFGAEYTRARTLFLRSSVRPKSGAEWLPGKDGTSLPSEEAAAIENQTPVSATKTRER